MARPRKTLSAEEELRRAEELVLKKKAELDEAVTDYSALRKTSIRRRENIDTRQGKRQSTQGTQ